MQITVGIAGQQYPEVRNIIGKVPEATYRLCRDRYSIERALRQRLKMSWNPDIEFAYSDWNLNGVQLLHFFNHVSTGSTPFVTTFETYVPRPPALEPHSPRLRRVLERQAEALSRPACRKLIAISESARKCQAKQSKHMGYSGELDKKTEVLHPPQEVRSSCRIGYHSSRPIVFTLVGHYFFSKGGLELLQAMETWNRLHPGTVKLNIVSRISLNLTATTDDEDSRIRVMQAITRNQHWIQHYPVLSPEEVLSLQTQTDVGLLPSIAETYGYSILEFQSLGVPVLTTNIRAMPEINSDATGWVVPLPTDELGYIDRTVASEHEIRSQLRADLLNAIETIVSSPDLIEIKGQAAQQRIREQHDPTQFANTLRRIYVEAVG